MLIERKIPWGVLIYACGNNDLEPEITSSVLSLLGTNRFEDVSVAVQLGRAPHKLVSVLRPGFKDQFQDDQWRGVRRFLWEGGSGNNKFMDPLEPVEDLGNLNLACPNALRDFLIWATRAVNARQYMVALSGHGAGFIGCMADFSHGRPQIMSVTQMSKAFQTALNHTGKKVSYLLMDACYMNLVENAFEFALHKAAKIFLGSGGFVPLKGYDYRLFIERFCNKKSISLQHAVEMNRDSFSGAEAVLVDKKLLTLLKELLSGLAKRLICLDISPAMINSSDETLISLSELLKKIIHDFSADRVLTRFSKKALKLMNIINFTGSGMKIFCPGQREIFIDFVKYYSSISFSKNNFWPLWLSGGESLASDCNDTSSSNDSTFLPLGVLTEHLMNLNAGLTMNEVREIYQKLGWSPLPL
jgi:hypothetical protein